MTIGFRRWTFSPQSGVVDDGEKIGVWLDQRERRPRESGGLSRAWTWSQGADIEVVRTLEE